MTEWKRSKGRAPMKSDERRVMSIVRLRSLQDGYCWTELDSCVCVAHRIFHPFDHSVCFDTCE